MRGCNWCQNHTRCKKWFIVIRPVAEELKPAFYFLSNTPHSPPHPEKCKQEKVLFCGECVVRGAIENHPFFLANAGETGTKSCDQMQIWKGGHEPGYERGDKLYKPSVRQKRVCFVTSKSDSFQIKFYFGNLLTRIKVLCCLFSSGERELYKLLSRRNISLNCS